MTSIPITDAGDADPLPICGAYREWLVTRYRVDSILALKYLTDDRPTIEAERDSERKAIDHIRHCPKCKEWINRVIPKDIFQRQKRMLRYCCAGMFCATEEYKERDKTRITFELFRGEDPCWMIDGKRSFISFCPWCGKKLPDKPFIP